jgi:hypothetical protein
MSPGRRIALLLADPVCRDLVDRGYQSVAQAAGQSRFSREQVGEALRRLELAGLVETHKAGQWTLQAGELRDVLGLIEELPGERALLGHLAHPVGFSIIARLASRDQTRAELSDCGDPPRVSEQLQALRQLGVVRRHSALLSLSRRTGHLALLDRLDRIAGNLHMQAFQIVRKQLFAPSERGREGAAYARSARPPRSSENASAVKAYNYTRAAYLRAQTRTKPSPAET